jgi:hypothetical protein
MMPQLTSTHWQRSFCPAKSHLSKGITAHFCYPKYPLNRPSGMVSCLTQFLTLQSRSQALLAMDFTAPIDSKVLIHE